MNDIYNPHNPDFTHYLNTRFVGVTADTDAGKRLYKNWIGLIEMHDFRWVCILFRTACRHLEYNGEIASVDTSWATALDFYDWYDRNYPAYHYDTLDSYWQQVRALEFLNLRKSA